MLRIEHVSVIALAASLLWGCSGGGSSSTPAPTSTPTSAPTPSSTATPTHAPSPVAGGRTWYVSLTGRDTATGQIGAPLRNIQTAVDNAGPGDVIVVMAGSYTETVLFSGADNSGQDNAPITLFGENGASLDGGALSPSGVQGLVTIRNASHITVIGLELRNFRTEFAVNATDTPSGVLVTGSAQNIELNNLNIHDIENRSSCTLRSGCGPSANGIGVFGNTIEGIRDIRILNNEVYNNTLASSEAVTLNGNVSRFQVIGNTVRDNNNIGIDLIGLESDICTVCSPALNRARNGLVRDNVVLNNSNTANAWYDGDNGNAVGIYVDGGEYIVIERNQVTGNDIGIEVSSEAPNGTASNVLVASNAVFGNREAGMVFGGYSAATTSEGGGSVSNLIVANNTLYQNRGWGTEINLQYRVSDTQFINNIISGVASQRGNLNLDDTSYSGLVWTNNLWWASGAKDGVPVTDPAAISADPDFADASADNFRLNAGSPAEDAGANVDDIASWFDAFWSDVYSGGVINGAGSSDVYGSERIRVILDVGAAER